MEKKVVLLWLLTISFWGVSPIIEKVALRNVDPMLCLFVRTGVSLIVMALLLPLIPSFSVSKLLELSPKDYLFISLSGIIGGFLGMFCYFSMLKYESASKVVPLTATYPLVATLLGILVLKESLTLNKVLGTILVTLGIMLLLKTP